MLPLLCGALAAAGCEEPAAADPGVAVELAVTDSEIGVRKVFSVADYPLHRPRSPALLRYRLDAADGTAIVSGLMPDPRFAVSEGQDETGAWSVELPRAAFGTAHLRLPGQAGTLVVVEPHEGGDREVGRVAFDPRPTPAGDGWPRPRAPTRSSS